MPHQSDVPDAELIPPWLRMARLALGVLIVAAVIEDYRQTTDRLGNFLSFFTIQSNLFGALILVLGATTLVPSSERWDYVRGGALIFLALTGVVYNVLLRTPDNEVDPWITNTLHVVAPVLMVVDFLVAPFQHRLTFARSLWWTIYPLAYAGFSLVRGALVDWYPYEFLNPNADGGWTNVIVHIIVISVGFLVVSWVVVRFSNWRLASNRTSHDR